MMRWNATVQTGAREEMLEITPLVAGYVGRLTEGLVTVFVPHTTAGITINENADPDARRDLIAHLGELVPARPSFLHAEGNSDAHIKASLMGSSITVPFFGSRMLLGQWQGIYFCEFDGPRTRQIVITAYG